MAGCQDPSVPCHRVGVQRGLPGPGLAENAAPGVHGDGMPVGHIRGRLVPGGGDPHGEALELLAKHRKAHLFDIDVEGGQRFRESDVLSPGNAVTTFETEFGREPPTTYSSSSAARADRAR